MMYVIVGVQNSKAMAGKSQLMSQLDALSKADMLARRGCDHGSCGVTMVAPFLFCRKAIGRCVVMPINYLRKLTGRRRSQDGNLHLGFVLAFIAGAINAGGFLAIQQYTSHMTGIVTDIGIEIGKLVYWNTRHFGDASRVIANRDRLKVLTLLAVFFFSGGVLGALGFKYVGYVATVPLALFLVVLAMIPVMDDIILFWRRMSQ